MHSFERSPQRGSSLIITMVLLIVLTVIAIRETSFNSTLTRIATNSSDALVAMSTTEGALNYATNSVINGNYSIANFIGNANGLYLFNPANTPIWRTINWSSTGSVIQSYQGDSSVTASYIIEQLPSITAPGQSTKRPTSVYRITVRGVGTSGTAPIILQSIVQVPQ